MTNTCTDHMITCTESKVDDEERHCAYNLGATCGGKDKIGDVIKQQYQINEKKLK